jgi:hypothetical protein
VKLSIKAELAYSFADATQISRLSRVFGYATFG